MDKSYIVIRKGRRVIARYTTAYHAADDIRAGKITITGAPEGYYEKLAQAVAQDAFCFAIKGAKMRLGGGYILENQA